MKLFSFHSFRQRLNAAFLAVSLVPMLILYLLTQKKMMTSLAGGIKG